MNRKWVASGRPFGSKKKERKLIANGAIRWPTDLYLTHRRTDRPTGTHWSSSATDELIYRVPTRSDVKVFLSPGLSVYDLWVFSAVCSAATFRVCAASLSLTLKRLNLDDESILSPWYQPPYTNTHTDTQTRARVRCTFEEIFFSLDFMSWETNIKSVHKMRYSLRTSFPAECYQSAWARKGNARSKHVRAIETCACLRVYLYVNWRVCRARVSVCLYVKCTQWGDCALVFMRARTYVSGGLHKMSVEPRGFF